MKYLVMVYGNPWSREMWASFTDEQRAEGFRIHNQLRDSLIASGELIMSEALADPSTATRVTARENGEVVTSDGPFAEAKELLAGFYLVDCDNRESAVAIAARVPEAAFGLVEVRPVMDMRGLEM
ncbi:MAG TPA: YciI family protein [Asanoa sp.]